MHPIEKILLNAPANTSDSSQVKYSTNVYDLIHHALYAIDLEGNIVYANRAAHERLSHLANEKKQLNLWTLFQDADAPAMRDFFDQVTKQGIILSKQHFILHNTDSGVRHILFSAQPLFADEAIIGLVAMEEDISDQINAQNTLTKERVKYQTLFEQAPTAIAIIDPFTAKHLASNKKLATLLGYNASEMDNLTIFDYEFGESSDATKAHIKRILTQGEDRFETRIKTKNGEIKEIIVNAKVVEWDSCLALHTIYEDISKEKRLISALSESKDRFKAIFNGSPEAIFLADPANGIILDANEKACRLLKMSKEQVIGKHQSQLHPPEKKIYSQETFKEHSNMQSEARIIDSYVLCSDGQHIPVEILAHVFEIDNKPVIMGTFRDISSRRTLEKKIELSYRIFSTVLDNLDAIVYVADMQNHQILFANALTKKLFGNNIDGKICWQVLQKNQTGPCDFCTNQYLVNDQGKPNEAYHWKFQNTVTGQILAISDSAIPWIDGSLVRIEIARDISEEQRIDNELALSHQILEQMPDAILLTDFDGNILRWMGQAPKLFGYNSAEILRRNIRILLSPANEQRNIETMFQAQQSIGNFLGEITFIRKDGSEVPIETQSKTIYDAQGKATAIIAINRDISERRQTSLALRRSQQYLEEAQQIGRLGHWLWDRDNDELIWSDEVFRIFGYSPKAFKPTAAAFEATIHPEDIKEFLQQREQMLNEHQQAYIEHRILRPDGQIRHVAERTKLELDAKGVVTRVFGTVQDITERKMAEQALKATLIEKDILLKEIHHRVKNNLQMVISLLFWQENDLTDKNSRLVLRENQQRIRSMLLVHEQLYQSEKLSTIDFGNYIKKLCFNLFHAYKADTRNIDKSLHVNNIFLPITLAIPCALLLNEAISNCLKHAFPEGRKGHIHVSLTKKNAIYELLISDNGIGLPPNLDITQKGSMGMELIKGLCENQLRGKLQVRSQGGTSLTVSFPAQDIPDESKNGDDNESKEDINCRR